MNLRFAAMFVPLFLLVFLSSTAHAVRIAKVPDNWTMEIAIMEFLHNRETGGGMLIATPAGPCEPCSPVTLTYDETASLSVNGFDTDKVIDRSQVIRGSVSYDPETLKVSSININE